MNRLQTFSSKNKNRKMSIKSSITKDLIKIKKINIKKLKVLYLF